VIDIASGSGLVAIAAVRAGAAAVTAYDIDPLAVAAISVNAAANGAAVQAVHADVLGQDGPPSPGADLVLVADAFYQRDLARDVMRFLERGCAPGTAVMVGDFGRAYLPRDRLTPLAAYDVPGQRVLEDSDIKRTTVWTLPGTAGWPRRGSLRGRPDRLTRSRALPSSVRQACHLCVHRTGRPRHVRDLHEERLHCRIVDP
jgi:predicted nicotinamide N-methyase